MGTSPFWWISGLPGAATAAGSGPAYEKIAEEYGDQLVVAKVNIDEEGQLAEAERVEVIPTLILYKNGKAVDSVVNPGSKAAIDNSSRRLWQSKEANLCVRSMSMI